MFFRAIKPKIMKKHIFSILALAFVAQIAWADKPVTAPADIPTYYSAANGKSGSSLYSALNTIANKGFSSLGYDGAITAYQKSDVYPSDPNHPDYVAGKAGKLWDMYGGCSFTSGDECGNYSGECDCYNREHSVPKSWWGGGKNDMYSDIFHLVPTDGYVNNRRSNYAFGEVTGNPKYEYNGCKLGSPAEVSTTKSTILGTSASCSANPVFEPRDEYKGDFARGYLGMIAKYSNTSYSITSGDGGQIFEAFKSTTHFGLTKYGVVLLMKWHREDPVSRKEIDRNNGIQATQGNRNPFIDYPYLAEYIWGEKAGETVDMSKLIASCEEGFIPGQSNGWRDGSTPVVPPTPVKKYGVTWVVNGTILTIDSVPENTKPAALPDEPTSCSETSESFYGWAGGSWPGVLPNYLPDDIIEFSNIDYMPNVVFDVTYHAVFAHKSTIGSATPATYTYSTDSKDGWTNTGTWTNNSYWLLDQGKALTSPEVDLSGLTSIQVRMRTYGGTNYNQFSVAAGDKVITTIEATKGSTMTDYEWTNTSSLTGASPLTFTCSNAASSRGIGFQSVTINATGAGTVYENFITDCQGTTDAVNTHAEAPASKVLIGGQIYIFVGDALYTITGQKVQGR